jgi:membrane-associated phospholipid phosphatase
MKVLRIQGLVLFLVIAALALGAVLIHPYDTGIFHYFRSFASRAGKYHLIREVLEMFRPLGQGDVILMIAFGLGLCGARRHALHIIIGLAVMAILITPVKIGVGRERPAFKNFQSFPSGDVATVAVFVTPFACLAPWSVPAAVLVTGGVALERVYYGRHYASDALAGAGFGVLSAALALAVLQRWRWRPKRHWCALAGLLLVTITAIASFLRPGGAFYLLDVLRVWGPLGMFLILARLVPTWVRKHRTNSGLIPQKMARGGVGSRLLRAAGLMGGCVLVVVPWFMPVFGLRIPLVVMGLLALFTAHVIGRLKQRNHPESILIMTVFGFGCAILSLALSLIPAIHAYRNAILTF